MFQLVAIGVMSGLFFSTTFVLNRLMSLQGGHWVWTASLRYAFMLAFMLVGLVVFGKDRLLRELWGLYRRNWLFWTIAGTIGFGLFYACISYSASFAPAWVVATTWQATILATPLVLLAFGKRVPWRALLFSLVIFAGVVLVNVSQAESNLSAELLQGALPVIAAAFCYPIGNQLVWEVRRAVHPRLPRIDSPVLDRPFAGVLLLTLGSIPFWLALVVICQPPPPSAGQVLQTALVALFSGIIATGLFFFARQKARTPYQLSAVDATQGSEAVFALIGEVLFLHAALPTVSGYLGLAMTVVGLFLYLHVQAH
ncbi:MAG: multidrug resistance efflux transporter family protein [Desulforhopalus sp.]|nr:multidrug resistance efflux transporter family protein [Desulforhopalus sp.]